MLVRLSTEGGKGRLRARFAACAAAEERHVLVIAQRSELLDQISTTFLEDGGGHGRFQSGLGPSDEMVAVGMVQTVCGCWESLPSPDFLLVDEGHYATASQYRGHADARLETRVLGVPDAGSGPKAADCVTLPTPLLTDPGRDGAPVMVPTQGSRRK